MNGPVKQPRCHYRRDTECVRGVFPSPVSDEHCANCLHWIPVRQMYSCNCERDMADASSRRPEDIEQILRE